MFKNPIFLMIAIFGGATLTGCIGFEDSDLGTTSKEIISSAETTYVESLSAAEKLGTIDFLNDSNTTKKLLDGPCGLYSDAAKKLADFIKKEVVTDLLDVADVKNVGISNLTRVVECARARGFIAVEVTTYVYDINELDPALVAVIHELEANGNPCAPCVACDPSSSDPYTGCDWSDPNETSFCFPVEFAEATIVTVSGVPVRYRIVLYQASSFDPEAPSWSISYDLDSTYNHTDVDCVI